MGTKAESSTRRGNPLVIFFHFVQTILLVSDEHCDTRNYRFPALAEFVFSKGFWLKITWAKSVRKNHPLRIEDGAVNDEAVNVSPRGAVTVAVQFFI